MLQQNQIVTGKQKTRMGTATGGSHPSRVGLHPLPALIIRAVSALFCAGLQVCSRHGGLFPAVQRPPNLSHFAPRVQA